MKPISIFSRLILMCAIIAISSSLRSANFYWVGGTGNWSDYNGHWATQSGGQIFWSHVPTPQDTVIFDSLSFVTAHDTVYTNTNSIYCHTMKWLRCDSMPVFTNDTSNSKLRIYGSMFLDSTTQWCFYGAIIFCGSDSGNVISTLGKQLNYVQFSGDTIGSWTLMDTLRVGWLSFRSGDFHSNGQTMIIGLYEQDHLNYSRQYLDSSDVVCGKFRNHNNPIYFDAFNATFNVYGDSLEGGGLTFGKIILPYETALSGSNNIGHLQVSGNSTIIGSNSIGLFESTRGGIIITLSSGSTQTITDSMIFNGSCRGFSAFMCSYLYGIASIDFQYPNPYAESLFLENVNATGNPTANNSVLMNSSGWNATNVPSPRNLYWVGGTGNWSDTAHWSISSGGLGDECAPTPIDDVNFDALSFSNAQDVVSADNNITFFNDMSWNGAAGTPVFAQDTGRTLCYGSLVIQSTLGGFQSQLTMRSPNQGTSVVTPGISFPSICFDGRGGWLQQSALSAGSILWYNGDYNSNGNSIQTSWAGLYATMDILDFTGSQVSAPGHWYVTSSGTLLTPDTLNTYWLTDYGPHAYHDVIASGSFILNCNCTFDDVNIGGSANIYGNNQYDTIMFTGGEMRIVLEAGSTQTIVGDLQITSSCIDPVALESSYSGGTAFISKSSGVINCDYLIMQDIHAIGGATFNATNTCATYNVSGWNVTPPPSWPMYWIGGSGNWKDPNHWSLSSGGGPGTCIPNPLTDVYFDANSFASPQQSVNLNCRYAYCHSMDWTGATGNPSMNSGSNILFCYGSLILDQGVSTSGVNLTMRSHATGNVINPQNAVMGFVLLDGIAGEWSLTDSLICDSFNLINGAFYTMGNPITTRVLRSDTTCVRELHLDSSVVTTHDWIIEQDAAMILDATRATVIASGERFTGGQNRSYNKVVLQQSVRLTDSDTIHELQATGSVSIEADIVVDTLRLNAPGEMITIQTGDTIFIDSAAIASSSNSAYIGIQSSDPIGQAYIVKTTDSICFEYMIMNGIAASGGANFFGGEYSSDIGYNSGWTWQNCYPGFVNVWPGDANYDLVADNFDILAIGVAYGEMGGVRPNASLTWIAQPNSIWQREFADSTDIVHADCDGDGIIGQSDTTAVSLNYGLNHPARLAQPEESVQLNGAELQMIVPLTFFQPGDTVEIPIMLGTQNGPLQNGYGVAFTLNWDHPFIEPGTLELDYSNSWFTPAGNIVHLEKSFYPAQACDVGVSRISHTDSSGGGELATLRFVLTQNANGSLKFWFTQTILINHNEDSLDMVSSGGAIVAAVGIDEQVTPQAMVFPNPASENISITTNLRGEGTITIYDATGRIVKEETVSNVMFIQMNLAELAQGSYTLHVTANNATAITRFQIVN